jgi:hypothetical protein
MYVYGDRNYVWRFDGPACSGNVHDRNDQHGILIESPHSLLRLLVGGRKLYFSRLIN